MPPKKAKPQFKAPIPSQQLQKPKKQSTQKTQSVPPTRLQTKVNVSYSNQFEQEYIKKLISPQRSSRSQHKLQIHKRNMLRQLQRQMQTQMGIDTYKQPKKQQIDPICMACMTTEFSQNMRILPCNHVFCNDCFEYWSTVSNQCPTCYIPCQYVHKSVKGMFIREGLYHRTFRFDKCQKCKSESNEQQKYLCDFCQKACIHLYCDQKLRNLKENQNGHWICQKCKIRRNKEKEATRQQIEEFKEIFLHQEYQRIYDELGYEEEFQPYDPEYQDSPDEEDDEPQNRQPRNKQKRKKR